MMTPGARRALHEILGQSSLQLLQVGKVSMVATTITTTTTTAAPTYVVHEVPTNQEPIPSVQWKKCNDGPVNCGLLHDTMSLQWGKFKDLVDELQEIMDKNQDHYNEVVTNLNGQLSVVNDEKTVCMEKLAESISNINADADERTEKDEQERELRHEYEKKMAVCHAKITEIMYTNICAVRKVRNAVMTFSSTSKPSQITDCVMSDWIPGSCPKACDNTCPQEDPYKCGAWQWLYRRAIVNANQFGVKCPGRWRRKKCGQIKCPVDCVMSQWSGWSKCTKECESGVQVRTRSIVTKPMHGGKFCDTVQEERSCNTGSCDRDCTLKKWSKWSWCSMSCNGGIQTHHRKVLVPIRGLGKCPKPTSYRRFGTKKCNTQKCVGDEVCIAQQDLIIAIDGSGSVREEGFNVIRDFAANLTDRYKDKYFGKEAMKIGVVLFGNGHVLDDGTITNAINVLPLTNDMDAVRKKILEVKWQRGFTNMAQAFSLADTMLTQGGRSEAQSAVMVLSDGKPSFWYQTVQKARELHDKNIQVFMSPITSFKSKELRMMREKLASQPWRANYFRIPGLDVLEHNMDVFKQQVIATFCPDSMSLAALRQKEDYRKYMLIREDGYPNFPCGGWFYNGNMGVDDCAAQAREAGMKAFFVGKGKYRRKYCYASRMAVTQDLWNKWSAKRKDPECPGGNEAKWLPSKYFDTYAINPDSIATTTAAASTR